jgi:hypothetical protein
MKNRLSARTRLVPAAVAFMTAVLLLLTNAQPARAVGVSTITNAVRSAYGAYLLYVQGQIALLGATQAIVGAINSAKVEILNHIDMVAAANVQACAEASVISVEDIDNMSSDAVEAFALYATDCVTQAKSQISNAGTSVAAVDQLGFALNSVGPIALLARAHAGYTTTSLNTALISANNTLIPKLTPQPGPVVPAGHCFASANTGDQPPGEILEYIIRCTAYNGDTGFDSCWGCVRYTTAQVQATRNTSRPVAVAALGELT